MTVTKNTEKLFSVVFTLTLICLMTGLIIPGVKGVSTVNLGSADYFAILAKTAITDTPVSNITGNVGLSPTTGAITGLTCAEVSGTIYTVDEATGPYCRVADPVLLTEAVSDMQTAYTNANGITGAITYPADTDLSGQTLTPGLYNFPTSLAISTGNLILDPGTNTSADAVWIFQVGSTLDTTGNYGVILANGAQAQNVFWVVGGATTLGTGSGFNGTILDSAAITLGNGATLNGRALAQSAVTLDGANTVTAPASAIEITVANVPIDALSLNPDTATTNSATQYFVNSCIQLASHGIGWGRKPNTGLYVQLFEC